MHILPIGSASSSPPSYRSQSSRSSQIDLADALALPITTSEQQPINSPSPPSYREDMLSRRPTADRPPLYDHRFQDAFLVGDQHPSPPSKALAGLAFIVSSILVSAGLTIKDQHNRRLNAPTIATFCGLAAPIAAGGLVQLYRICKYHFKKQAPLLPIANPNIPSLEPRPNQTAFRSIPQGRPRNSNPTPMLNPLDTQQALMTPPAVRLGLLIAQLTRGMRQTP